MDPLGLPIATVMRPFLIPKMNSSELRNYQRAPNRGKEFVIKEHWHQEINKATNFGSNKPLKVQIRCLRLDGIGFEHCWPKFGRGMLNN